MLEFFLLFFIVLCSLSHVKVVFCINLENGDFWSFQYTTEKQLNFVFLMLVFPVKCLLFKTITDSVFTFILLNTVIRSDRVKKNCGWLLLRRTSSVDVMSWVGVQRQTWALSQVAITGPMCISLTK